MTYRVDLRPDVRDELNKLSMPLRNRFDLAVSELIDNPFPRPGFDFIAIVENEFGDRFYSYLDDTFPYVLEYDVEPAEPDDELAGLFDGYISIFSLKPLAGQDR